MTFFQRNPSAVRILLYGGAAVLSALVFLYLQFHGFVNVFADAKSHMLQSIHMVYSQTPGISQLGFWPPLLHLLLLPAVILLPRPVLLIAGSLFTMLPLLLVGAHFLYGICRLRGVSPRISVLAPALFVLHPFVQYFTSSAMSELPLIVTVFGATYFALRWSEKTSLLDLSLFGIFVSLASISRFEGFALIPLAIAFVTIRCWSLKMPWEQMKANVVTFTFVAVLGGLFIMLYSTVYAGSPLSFLSLGTERVGQSNASLRVSGLSFLSVLDSLNRVYRASIHMHGTWMIAASVAAVAVLLAMRRKWIDIATLLFLFSPVLFILMMMSLGRNAISVPELPRSRWDEVPYGLFYNARFALTWVGAAIVVIVLAVDALMNVRFLRMLTVFLVIPCIVLCTAARLAVVIMGNFEAIRLDEQALAAFSETTRTEEENLLPDYDGGRVLFARYYGEDLMLHSSIPLGNFIYEGNYQYFDQAIREPWLFVRWVVVRHALPDQRGANVNTTKIFRVMLEMEAMPEFQHYYELVQGTSALRYYRLREYLLREQAVSLGYDPEKIPSLNPNAPWRPKTIYEELKPEPNE